MSDITLPPPERRRELSKLIPTLTEGLETDATEFRRLVRSFQRRPQMLFLRELLRTGPARRSPENEASWKSLRNLLLPILEKGEIQEAELPWFLSWLARLTTTRLPRFLPQPQMDRPAVAERSPFGRPSGPPGPAGPAGRPSNFGDRFNRDRGPGGGGGQGGGRPPFRGPGGPPGGGRGGPGGGRDRDRDRDRGGFGGNVKMPPGPREVDTRWDALKAFKTEDEDKKDKK